MATVIASTKTKSKKGSQASAELPISKRLAEDCGKFLKRVRSSQNLSRKDLAMRLTVMGVKSTETGIGGYETGATYPTRPVLEALTLIFDNAEFLNYRQVTRDELTEVIHDIPPIMLRQILQDISENRLR